MKETVFQMFKVEAPLTQHPWLMVSSVYPDQEKTLRRLGWRKTKHGAVTAGATILTNKIAAFKSAITIVKKVK